MAISDAITVPRVGVLIHGCHLKAEKWHHIVFGSGDRLGRVPVGIAEAVHRNAKLIFWGTGVSVPDQRLKESEYTYDQTTGTRLDELSGRLHLSSADLFLYLNEVSYIDKKSQNTTEEIASAIYECRARGIQELYLVSSPTHIARCLQEACKLQESQEAPLTIYATASQTCFADSTAGDVVIVEPPHRGDMPHEPIHRTLRGMFPLLRDERLAHSFNQALARIIEEHKQLLTPQPPAHSSSVV